MLFRSDVCFHENIFPYAASVHDSSDPFVSEVDVSSSSAITSFVTPISIPDASTNPYPPCTSSHLPSIPLPIPLDPSPPSEPVVTSISLDSASVAINIPTADPPQLESPPELTKLQHTYRTMLAIQLSCHLALLLLMYQALLMPLQIVSLIVIWMLLISPIS